MPISRAPKVWVVSDFQVELAAKEYAQQPVTQTDLRDAIATLLAVTMATVNAADVQYAGGMKQDGSTDDSAALIAAASAAAGKVLLIPPSPTGQPARISQNVTLGATVTLLYRGTVSPFTIDSGKTVTTNGPAFMLGALSNVGLGTFTATVNSVFVNPFGFGFGVHEPNNTDSYFYLERNNAGATGFLIRNLSETPTSESFGHWYGGALNVGADFQIRVQSSAMGGNVNMVAGHGTSAGNFNIIESDNKPLSIYTNNVKMFEFTPAASVVNWWGFKGGAAGSGLNVTAAGSDTDISLNVNAKGAGLIAFRTQAGGASQFIVLNTTSAARQMTVTGSAAGNPTFSTNGGGLVGFGKTVVFLPSTTTQASANMASGVAPTSPVSGDWWYDGTNLKFRDGVTTRTITWT